MIIYLVTNIINGKEYIGQTIFSIEKRKRGHISDALSGRNNIYFHKAIRKHGPDSFKWKIIHKCNDINELNRLEIFYIGYYDTYNSGYNLTLGGRGHVGYKHTEEAKLKMSESRRGNQFAKGFKHTDETKRKISMSCIGVNFGAKSSGAVAIIINNKYFNTRDEAAKFIGISSATVRRRILHKTRWSDYHYV